MVLSVVFALLRHNSHITFAYIQDMQCDVLIYTYTDMIAMIKITYLRLHMVTVCVRERERVLKTYPFSKFQVHNTLLFPIVIVQPPELFVL
jgi:hypothetical protein